LGVMIWAPVAGVWAMEEQGPQTPVLVVVDPGHGGEDEGASAPDGTLEKDLNLKLARVLLEEAQSMTGFQVRLTRDRDETVSWRSRRLLSQGADLWLSLHTNADFQGRARGPRVFYTQRDTQEENQQKGPSGEGSDLGEILRDMAKTEWINESILLGEHIQRALDTAWGVSFRPSRPAPLLGMQDLGCPAVLVEVGFLSNAADRRGLVDAEKGVVLARAIMRGVRAYALDPRRGH
jgi:N-acetylmuramoyl-L-alanine amidase